MIDKLIIFLLSFIGGICFASYFFSFAFLGFILSFLLLIFPNKKSLLLFFCVILFSIGMFCVENKVKEINQNPLISLNEEIVSLDGIISKEVRRGYDKTQIVVDVIDNDKFIGKVLIYTDKYSFFEYRDKIKIEGLLRVPQKLDDFDYQGYLAKSGVVATISYPKIEITERLFFSNIFQKVAYLIYKQKETWAENIRERLPYNLSPSMEAMILGNDSMSKDFKTKLSISGLSHAIAISGSHIVLFSTMIFWVFLTVGLWRKQALVASIIFTLFYIFLTGMPSSGVRSGIMMSLMFLAELFDRKAFNLRTLVVALGIMLFFNPLLLRYDLGLQLSFLAVLGIILMGPVFNQWLSFIKWKYIREIISITFAAQIFTLPILISSFGYFSIISLISNIVVIPVMPLLMAIGILLPFISLLSIPATVLLAYLVFIVNFSSQFSFAVLSVQLPVIILVLFYIPFLFIAYKSKKKDLEFLGQ
ncbi:MAG: ComEC/Rec2 family competence protein [Candidatus Pacebacteria bacterium]|nr:ComEC/Rec2 family competence protein [Candidatus Paceibacterota bacterium]MDD4074028.1 ComEC/Rec2 family competence protein [Candidatus Paceibacterota bacterium]